MIILRNISLRRGSKLLLADANVTIQPGQRLALIGANGSGKSSLFSMLLGELGADIGSIEGLNTLRLSHIAQEVHTTSIGAAEYIWRGDEQLAGLRDQLKALEAVWKHAEEIAEISDNLLLPEGTEEFLDEHRED